MTRKRKEERREEREKRGKKERGGKRKEKEPIYKILSKSSINSKIPKTMSFA